jgi:LysM repeat protein
MDKKSKLGYKKNSPYKNKESLLINSNVITTKDMAFPILATGNGGESVILYPNTGDFIFPSSTKVKEMKIPKYQGGGYVVKKGDTLSKIAKELGVSVNDLASYNNLKDLNKISVGQNLKVPSASPSFSSFDLRRDSILADFPKINVVDTNSYTVSKGDTLGSIAKKYNVSVSDLASYNNIQNINRIGEGQNIRIPANAKKTFSKNELVSEYQKEKNKPTPKIPVTYDDKKLYQGFDESKIDNEQVVMSYLRGKEPFVIVNKKTNTLRRYDKNGNLIGEMRVGLGYDQGDKFTINSKNKKVDRNTTPGGIYIVDEQKPNEDYTHLYDNNILLLKNQGGLRQATSIHQVPSNSPQRNQRLADSDLTNDDFSNGCVNCNREQYEKYLKTVMPGEKVVIIPEEDGNYFAVKNGELSFTTNRNKEFGQYNFTPKSKTYRELNYDFKADTDLKRQYVKALKNEKQKLMKDLNLTSDEYDELAKRSYGIFGQESSFGKGSIAPWNDFGYENLYSIAFDSPEERNQRTLGLSQVNLSYLPQEFKERYGINETSLFYPYQAAVASMGVLADSLQATRNPKIRDQYPNMTPDNVYDYALTGYNKPKTLRAGKASGNNTYVQSVKSKYKTGGMKNLNEYEILSNYLPTLSPEEQDQFIDMYENSTPDNKMNILMKCGGMMKYQQGGLAKGQKVPEEYANAEVEGGETALTPDGMLMKFNGPSHAQGGINTNLEEGTKIFSEHLKVPEEVQRGLGLKKVNKKLSYAKLSEKLKTKPFIEMMNETDDPYKLNAAKVQLEKNMAMLESLFFAQEKDKEMKGMSAPQYTNGQKIYAQSGTEVESEINLRNLRDAEATLYPFRNDAGLVAPYMGPGRMSFYNGQTLERPNSAFISESVVAMDALRQATKNNGSLSGYYKKPSDFSNTPPVPELQNVVQDLSSISDRFTVFNDKFVMDPVTGKYYVRFSNGTYGPAEVKVDIQKIKNQPKVTGSKKQPSPQQTQFDQMWGEVMYDYARNNPNVVVPNSGLYTSETGGRDIPVDISIPRKQSSRAGKKVYGEQDWTSQDLMADFKARFPDFIAQNPNWDPTKEKQTAAFQTWHNDMAKKYGMPIYFTGDRGFSGIDDKFGQYTWSAPSFQNQQEVLPGPVQDTPAPTSPTAPLAQLPQRPINAISFAGPQPTAPSVIQQVVQPREREKFGINQKLLGTLADIGLVMSDRLNIDNPTIYNRQKNPMFNRFYEFDNREAQRMADRQIQGIMNSNLPEQVKQAQIAAVTSQMQDQQGRVDFANAQRYEQKREMDLNKLQQYTDANLESRINEFDIYRQKMARVKDLQNQFKANRKQQIVNSAKDYWEYTNKLNTLNELNPYFEISPITGRTRYKPQPKSELDSLQQKLNQYSRNPQAVDVGGGTKVADMGDFLVVTSPTGEVKIVEKNKSSQSTPTKEQMMQMYYK